MSILTRMGNDYRRDVCAPVKLPTMSSKPSEPKNVSVKVNTWTEWASAYYLGYEQYKDLRMSAGSYGLHFDGRRFWFRNAAVILTQEDDHYAVIYGDRPLPPPPA